MVHGVFRVLSLKNSQDQEVNLVLNALLGCYGLGL